MAEDDQPNSDETSPSIPQETPASSGSQNSQDNPRRSLPNSTSQSTHNSTVKYSPNDEPSSESTKTPVQAPLQLGPTSSGLPASSLPPVPFHQAKSRLSQSDIPNLVRNAPPFIGSPIFQDQNCLLPLPRGHSIAPYSHGNRSVPAVPGQRTSQEVRSRSVSTCSNGSGRHRLRRQRNASRKRFPNSEGGQSAFLPTDISQSAYSGTSSVSTMNQYNNSRHGVHGNQSRQRTPYSDSGLILSCSGSHCRDARAEPKSRVDEANYKNRNGSEMIRSGRSRSYGTSYDGIDLVFEKAHGPLLDKSKLGERNVYASSRTENHFLNNYDNRPYLTNPNRKSFSDFSFRSEQNLQEHFQKLAIDSKRDSGNPYPVPLHVQVSPCEQLSRKQRNSLHQAFKHTKEGIESNDKIGKTSNQHVRFSTSKRFHRYASQSNANTLNDQRHEDVHSSDSSEYYKPWSTGKAEYMDEGYISVRKNPLFYSSDSNQTSLDSRPYSHNDHYFSQGQCSFDMTTSAESDSFSYPEPRTGQSPCKESSSSNSSKCSSASESKLAGYPSRKYSTRSFEIPTSVINGRRNSLSSQRNHSSKTSTKRLVHYPKSCREVKEQTKYTKSRRDSQTDTKELIEIRDKVDKKTDRVDEGIRDETLSKLLYTEIEEEMTRALKMDIPVMHGSKPRVSELNPDAHTFAPICQDANGQTFKMIKKGGMAFFHPQAPGVTVNPNFVIPGDCNYLEGNDVGSHNPETQACDPQVLGQYPAVDGTVDISGQSMPYQAPEFIPCSGPVSQEHGIPATISTNDAQIIPNDYPQVYSNTPHPLAHHTVPVNVQEMPINPTYFTSNNPQNNAPHFQTMPQIVPQTHVGTPHPHIQNQAVIDQYSQSQMFIAPNTDINSDLVYQNTHGVHQSQCKDVLHSHPLPLYDSSLLSVLHHPHNQILFEHSPVPLSNNIGISSLHFPRNGQFTSTPTSQHNFVNPTLFHGVPDKSASQSTLLPIVYRYPQNLTSHPPVMNLQAYYALDGSPNTSVIEKQLTPDSMYLSEGKHSEQKVVDESKDPSIVRAVVEKLIGTVKKIEDIYEGPLSRSQLVDVLCGESMTIVNDVVSSYRQTLKTCDPATDTQSSKSPKFDSKELEHCASYLAGSQDHRLNGVSPFSYPTLTPVNLPETENQDSKAVDNRSPITFLYEPSIYLSRDQNETVKLRSPQMPRVGENHSDSVDSGVLTQTPSNSPPNTVACDNALNGASAFNFPDTDKQPSPENADKDENKGCSEDSSEPSPSV